MIGRVADAFEQAASATKETGQTFAYVKYNLKRIPPLKVHFDIFKGLLLPLNSLFIWVIISTNKIEVLCQDKLILKTAERWCRSFRGIIYNLKAQVSSSIGFAGRLPLNSLK